MSLTSFAPLANLSGLSHRINRLMDEMMPAAETRDAVARVWRPATDIWEDERALTLALDLPGVERESLDVQVKGDTLTIRGERPFERPEGVSYLHRERPQGQFVRSFTLGVPIQAEEITASYRDGVLTVTLPKAEAVRPRKITVTADDSRS
ncbi:MAG: Hsp20/alpha crystallin family protein [Armatimonadetes bacterium]|nr:Hsp20/alpha crystallin family protein [Armatimonadota bacterium]